LFRRLVADLFKTKCFDGLTFQDDERMVTREEGLAFAQESGCLFLESSAKTRENVEKCFEELALKVCFQKDVKCHNISCIDPCFLCRIIGIKALI
jgi:GTPase SAR1 family protein